MSEQLLQLPGDFLGEVRNKVDALLEQSYRPRQRMFASRHALPVEVRQEMAALLNQQLADTLDVYSQIKQTQWNIKGQHFFTLHGLLEHLAEQMTQVADRLAERVATLGSLVRTTVRHVAAQSRVREYPSELPDAQAHLEALVFRLSLLAGTNQAARTVAQQTDQDTGELLSQVSLVLDRTLWLLEAHMQR